MQLAYARIRYIRYAERVATETEETASDYSTHKNKTAALRVYVLFLLVRLSGVYYDPPRIRALVHFWLGQQWFYGPFFTF